MEVLTEGKDAVFRFLTIHYNCIKLENMMHVIPSDIHGMFCQRYILPSCDQFFFAF